MPLDKWKTARYNNSGEMPKHRRAQKCRSEITSIMRYYEDTVAQKGLGIFLF